MIEEHRLLSIYKWNYKW